MNLKVEGEAAMVENQNHIQYRMQMMPEIMKALSLIMESSIIQKHEINMHNKNSRNLLDKVSYKIKSSNSKQNIDQKNYEHFKEKYHKVDKFKDTELLYIFEKKLEEIFFDLHAQIGLAPDKTLKLSDTLVDKQQYQVYARINDFTYKNEKKLQKYTNEILNEFYQIIDRKLDYDIALNNSIRKTDKLIEQKIKKQQTDEVQQNESENINQTHQSIGVDATNSRSASRTSLSYEQDPTKSLKTEDFKKLIPESLKTDIQDQLKSM